MSGIIVRTLVVLAFARVASASSFVLDYYTQTVAYAGIGSNGVTQNSGQVTGSTSAIAGPLSDLLNGGVQSGSTSGSAGLDGTLRGYAAASNTEMFPIVQGLLTAEWRHTIEITGGAPGTPVQLGLGLRLSNTLSSQALGPGGPSQNAHAYLDGLDAMGFLSLRDHVLTPITNRQMSMVIDTTVGSIVYLGATLTLAVGAQATSESVDALNTGLFSLDVLTPGADYLTGSGTRFSTSAQLDAVPVPEPSTLHLTAVAAMGIAGLAVRRRRRARPAR